MKNSIIDSQKPYLMRAIYEWCIESNFTPYIAAVVDQTTDVPAQYVNDNHIVLNIDSEACSDLIIAKYWITFVASFDGIVHNIAIPIKNVIAIFAQENGQGMQFLPMKTNEGNS